MRYSIAVMTLGVCVMSATLRANATPVGALAADASIGETTYASMDGVDVALIRGASFDNGDLSRSIQLVGEYFDWGRYRMLSATFNVDASFTAHSEGSVSTLSVVGNSFGGVSREVMGVRNSDGTGIYVDDILVDSFAPHHKAGEYTDLLVDWMCFGEPKGRFRGLIQRITVQNGSPSGEVLVPPFPQNAPTALPVPDTGSTLLLLTVGLTALTGLRHRMR